MFSYNMSTFTRVHTNVGQITRFCVLLVFVPGIFIEKVKKKVGMVSSLLFNMQTQMMLTRVRITPVLEE